jgi:hypothetical protein
MAKRSGNELRVHDRVKNTVDLPGVPMGTMGKVILKNGFRWIRYRVWFDTDGVNGTDVGTLDRSVLQRVDRKGNPIEEAA